MSRLELLLRLLVKNILASLQLLGDPLKWLLNKFILRFISLLEVGAKKSFSAGREVVIKSVAQAIPMYSMSCFKLSKKTCKKITSCVSIFLVGW